MRRADQSPRGRAPRPTEKSEEPQRTFTDLGINNIFINIYEKGEFIHPHIDDCRFGPIIYILSLNSLTIFTLSRLGDNYDNIKIEYELEPNSLFILKDEYRYHWKHATSPSLDIRYSITFRTICDSDVE